MEIEIKSKSCKIALDQIRCVDKLGLENKIVSLHNDIMEKVDEALRIVLDLR